MFFLFNFIVKMIKKNNDLYCVVLHYCWEHHKTTTMAFSLIDAQTIIATREFLVCTRCVVHAELHVCLPLLAPVAPFKGSFCSGTNCDSSFEKLCLWFRAYFGGPWAFPNHRPHPDLLCTIILITQDSIYKIALTGFPNVWSATVIVETFALAGYRSPQDSSNELPFRRAMERGQPTTVAVAVAVVDCNVFRQVKLPR